MLKVFSGLVIDDVRVVSLANLCEGPNSTKTCSCFTYDKVLVLSNLAKDKAQPSAIENIAPVILGSNLPSLWRNSSALNIIQWNVV